MAAQKDLEKMLERFRNPGMSQTPKGSIGTTDDGKDTADARNKRALEIMGVDSAFRQPGMAAGRSSVPTGSPAGRLAGDLNTMRSPTQMSRQSVEQDLNPAIGESARLAMIEQQRLRSNMRGPGKMNPVEFRAAMAQMGQNQQAVDSGLAAIGDIRDASVTERGQSLQATTALRNRQMAEAGDFDQALLGIDKAMLTGEYGLARQESANRGADPYAPFVLDTLEQLVTSEDASMNDIMNAVNVARGVSAAGAPASTAPTIETTDGLKRTLTKGEALYRDTMGMDPRDREAILNINGYTLSDGVPVPIAQAEAKRKQEEAVRSEQEKAQREEQRRRMEAALAVVRENPPTSSGSDAPMNWVGGIR